MDVWLSLDIGGTKLAAAAFDGHRLLKRRQCDTNAQYGGSHVIDTLCRLLTDICQEIQPARPLALGVACPGPLSPSSGVVTRAPMLGWTNLPLVKLLSRQLCLPVVLENDANAAAYGEYRLGAGQGTASMAYITVSTGVGCGIVLNGQIWQGAHEGAGELGHLVIHPRGRHCACGRRGCLERYASGTAIGQRARALLPDMPDLDARQAAVLARHGNAACRLAFREAGDALGLGIAAMRQLLDVETVVLGGSVCSALPLFAPALKRRISASCYWGDRPETWLKTAALGGDSGLLGAALLAMVRHPVFDPVPQILDTSTDRIKEEML